MDNGKIRACRGLVEAASHALQHHDFVVHLVDSLHGTTILSKLASVSRKHSYVFFLCEKFLDKCSHTFFCNVERLFCLKLKANGSASTFRRCVRTCSFNVVCF